MTPQKQLRATRRGLNVLYKRIAPLRNELKTLERAFVKLSNMHFEADLQLSKIQTMPFNKSKAQIEAEDKRLMELIENMSEAKILQLFEKLEERMTI